jgi:L,D-peptidoglycan transpeptidase YkuD (ErfK/YbiS/YcfS/YnhG family)
MAKIPANAEQVVLVTGQGADSGISTVTRWQRDDDAWVQVSAEIPAHNGANGWNSHRREGDLSSPLGVFSLTSAGGQLASPGTKLPYEFRPSYYATNGTFMGASLADTFDYVVGIDYNHLPNTPPSDPRKPFGTAAGGYVWLHVDRGVPTYGCVSIPSTDMVGVLRWLDPVEHPVIVMGPATELSSEIGES